MTSALHWKLVRYVVGKTTGKVEFRFKRNQYRWYIVFSPCFINKSIWQGSTLAVTRYIAHAKVGLMLKRLQCTSNEKTSEDLIEASENTRILLTY